MIKNNRGDGVFTIVILLWWALGIVVAKGFWSTLFAYVFPPWAGYLAIELLYNRFLLIPPL